MESGQDEDHLLHVDKLLEGTDKYTHLFKTVEYIKGGITEKSYCIP